MKIISSTILLFVVFNCIAQSRNKIRWVKAPYSQSLYIGLVDDTVNYKHIVDNIYKDSADKFYILTQAYDGKGGGDSLFTRQYYKNMSSFFDLKTYKKYNKHFFSTNGKVYWWWINSDGEFPNEVHGADPITFVPFDSVFGGKDKNYVYYGCPWGVDTIKGANPKSIKVLGPYNHGCDYDCYFKDDENVFFEFEKIKGADVKSFKYIKEKLYKGKLYYDAKDKHYKYYKGKRIE